MKALLPDVARDVPDGDHHIAKPVLTCRERRVRHGVSLTSDGAWVGPLTSPEGGPAS